MYIALPFKQHTYRTQWQWIGVFTTAIIIHFVIFIFLTIQPQKETDGAKGQGLQGIEVGLKKLVSSTQASSQKDQVLSASAKTANPKPKKAVKPTPIKQQATPTQQAIVKSVSPAIKQQVEPTINAAPIVNEPEPIIEPMPESIIEPHITPSNSVTPDENTSQDNNQSKRKHQSDTTISQLGNSEADNINDDRPASLGGGNPKAIASYSATLRAWLERFKRYPSNAKRRGQEGVIHLQITIDRAGNVISYTLLKPSIYKALNKAVEKMVLRASPLPSVPDNLDNTKNTLVFTLPISFQLQ